MWLRSERGRHVESGATPDYCNFSNEAELAAIYAGIYRTVTKWPKTEAILVRSDCTTALQWMDGRSQARSAGARRLVKRIVKLKAEHNVRLIPRWVKAHRSGSDTDVWLNRRVDEMAREIMKNERQRATGNSFAPGPVTRSGG